MPWTILTSYTHRLCNATPPPLPPSPPPNPVGPPRACCALRARAPEDLGGSFYLRGGCTDRIWLVKFAHTHTHTHTQTHTEAHSSPFKHRFLCKDTLMHTLFLIFLLRPFLPTLLPQQFILSSLHNAAVPR